MGFTDTEIVVCGVPFGTSEQNYARGFRYLGGDPGPRQHPEYFLRESLATAAALHELSARLFTEAMSRADAVRAQTEERMKPTPQREYGEAEMVVCTQRCGVENGRQAPVALMLVGTVVAPDHPLALVAPKCFRSVVPKGVAPENCLVVHETFGQGKQRLYAGEFVRREDPRISDFPYFFREPRAKAGRGITTFNTYMMESTSPPRS